MQHHLLLDQCPLNRSGGRSRCLAGYMDASKVGEWGRAVVGHTHLLLHLWGIHHIHLDEVSRPDQQAFLLRQARYCKRAEKEECGNVLMSMHAGRSRCKKAVDNRSI